MDVECADVIHQEQMNLNLPNRLVLLSWIIPFLGLSLGLFVNFNELFTSNFDQTHEGIGDGRLVHYTLEHGYRWLRGDELNSNFWDPPIFYPAKNVSAFTDLMLGFGPYYWIWRVFDIDEWTAFQLWIVTIFVLNYCVSIVVLRKCTSANLIAVTPAAYFIAFGFHRHLGHVQMVPLFYMMIAFMAIFQLSRHLKYEPYSLSNKRIGRWFLLFFLCCVLQAYAAMYNLIFFSLYLILAVVLTLPQKEIRTNLFNMLLTNWRLIVLFFVTSILVLSPLIYHYGITLIDHGGRTFKPNAGLNSFMLITYDEAHWLYGFTAQWAEDVLPRGIGFITLGVSIYGLFRHWKRKNGYYLILPAVLTVIMGMNILGVNLWIIPYHLFPPAQAIRAVERIYILTLIPISFGLIWALEGFNGKMIWMSIILGLLCLIEQFNPIRFRAKKENLRTHIKNIVSKIDPTCDTFLLIEEEGQYDSETGYWEKQTVIEDAEWASLLAGVPTINGRYGNFPKRYGQLRKLLKEENKPFDTLLIRTKAQKWLHFNGKGDEKFCIVSHTRLKIE